MGELLRNLWSNQGAFLEAMGLVGAKLRGVITILATMVVSGAIDLGPYGWWGALAAGCAAQFIKAGDKNEPLIKRIEELEKR